MSPVRFRVQKGQTQGPDPVFVCMEDFSLRWNDNRRLVIPSAARDLPTTPATPKISPSGRNDNRRLVIPHSEQGHTANRVRPLFTVPMHPEKIILNRHPTR